MVQEMSTNEPSMVPEQNNAAEYVEPAKEQEPMTQEPSAEVPTTSAEAAPAAGPAPQGEMERVREIIMGPGTAQPKVRKTEADRLRETIFGSQMQDYERRFADLRRDMERTRTDLQQVHGTVDEVQRVQTKQVEASEPEVRRTIDDLRREVERLRGQDAVLQQVLSQTRQHQAASQDLSAGLNDLREAIAPQTQDLRAVKGSFEELRREVERLRAQEMTLQQLVTQSRQQQSAMQALTTSLAEVREAVNQQEQELKALKSALSDLRDQQTRKSDALRLEARQSDDDLRTELRNVADRLDDQKADRRALAGMLTELATHLETGSSSVAPGLLEGLIEPSKE